VSRMKGFPDCCGVRAAVVVVDAGSLYAADHALGV
jgi:hypothetical protein